MQNSNAQQKAANPWPSAQAPLPKATLTPEAPSAIDIAWDAYEKALIDMHEAHYAEMPRVVELAKRLAYRAYKHPRGDASKESIDTTVNQIVVDGNVKPQHSNINEGLSGLHFFGLNQYLFPLWVAYIPAAKSLLADVDTVDGVELTNDE